MNLNKRKMMNLFFAASLILFGTLKQEANSMEPWTCRESLTRPKQVGTPAGPLLAGIFHELLNDFSEIRTCSAPFTIKLDDYSAGHGEHTLLGFQLITKPSEETDGAAVLAIYMSPEKYLDVCAAITRLKELEKFKKILSLKQLVRIDSLNDNGSIANLQKLFFPQDEFANFSLIQFFGDDISMTFEGLPLIDLDVSILQNKFSDEIIFVASKLIPPSLLSVPTIATKPAGSNRPGTKV